MAAKRLKKFFPLIKKDPEVHEKFMMTLAIEEGRMSLKLGNGAPFGAAIAQNKKVISRGRNEVLKENDPTAHAEIAAIRKACQLLGTDSLEGCVLYSSCEPCPMCLAMCAMVKIEKIYYGASIQDAVAAGYKKKALDIFKNLKQKDYYKKSYCKQIMAMQSNIVLRQLLNEYPVEHYNCIVISEPMEESENYPTELSVETEASD